MKISFPKTIRIKLMAAAAGITLIISLLALTIYFFVFQSFLRTNQIQSSEFNLQLVTANVAANMADIIYFSKWTCSNSAVLHYLEQLGNADGLPPSASAVLEDVANIWEDFTSARFSGFSPEERELYERFAGRVQENIRGILQ